MDQVSGFRVWDLGFGLRVYGLGFRVCHASTLKTRLSQGSWRARAQVLSGIWNTKPLKNNTRVVVKEF